MPRKPDPFEMGLLQETRAWLEMASSGIDRADDLVFHITLGQEGRNVALRKISEAIDFLEKAKKTLAKVPIYNKPATECDP
jgi:hypothetical protein